ncbi:MAG: hypothetical protein LQ340_000938 [Diploschistes diacapsis]|nr:MAG: hypothetical protein LQ340_000938 [Diploschistes diacapsis]
MSGKSGLNNGKIENKALLGAESELPAKDAFEYSIKHWTWESKQMAKPGLEIDAFWLDLVGGSMAIPVPEDIMVQVNTGPTLPCVRQARTSPLGCSIFSAEAITRICPTTATLYIGNHTDEEVQWHEHRCFNLERSDYVSWRGSAPAKSNYDQAVQDASITTLNWVKDNPDPVEALNTVYSCQNRDMLQQRSVDHNVTDSLIDLETPE